MKRLILFLVIFICFSSFVYAQRVSNNIQTLLSTEGKVLYGDEPNSIMVIDYPENLSRIGEYLAALDVQPQQVLIEARVVEVKLQKEHSLGINWQLMAEKGFLKLGQFQLYGSSSTTGIGQNIPYQDVYETPGENTSAPVSPFTVTIFDENLNSVLKAMASQLDTNVLSAPRITTVNNRESEIKVIRRDPWVEPQVTTSDSGATTVTWTIHYEEIGIVLKVNPTINEDGRISMILVPEVSEKAGELPLTTAGITYKVPIIDKRTASTKVIIGNSQTLIIGGLIKNKSTDSTFKVPLIGDIPLLGDLFKSKHNYTEKTELLFLVSPTIITPAEFTHMAKKERYGIGRDYMLARDRDERMVLTIEKEEKDKEKQLSVELDSLVKRQKSLVEESKNLEEAVSKEEKNLKELVKTKNQVVGQRKALITK
jgi:general secretion pathway protein D